MNFGPVLSKLPLLADGLVLTLQITGTSMVIGFGLGILLALGRVYGPRPLRWLCGFYIQIFRGTPLLVQLSIFYYGLPSVGITFSAFTCGVLALGLNTAAYQAEYFRGAIQAVSSGQMQAARSIGMSRVLAIRTIVLPQALRLVIPAWSNELILMLKYSSIVFTVTLLDLTGVAKRIGSRHATFFEAFLVIAVFYMALVLIISTVLRLIERRVRVPGLGSPASRRR